MRADVLRELMDELDTELSGDVERAIARKTILRVADRYGLTCFDREEQITFAQHLLRNMREPRHIVRDRLMAAYGVSRSQAYRVLHDALQLSQKPGLFGTLGAFNDDGSN